MMWFFSVLVVVVMGVTAMVAAGRFGGLAEAYDDRPDSRVRADGPLTSADLEKVRFTSALRGYRMSEVDALLDRLADELRRAEEAAATPDGGAGDPDEHGAV